VLSAVVKFLALALIIREFMCYANMSTVAVHLNALKVNQKRITIHEQKLSQSLIITVTNQYWTFNTLLSNRTVIIEYRMTIYKQTKN